MPSYLTPTEGLPLVGVDFDVVEICPWPTEVVHISHNVFYCSQPFPVSKHLQVTAKNVGVIWTAALSATGLCINAYQDIVCDDSVCFLGPECGNRMIQHYTLDLIRTRVGFGVVCDVAIPKDAFIIEYVSEVLLGPDGRKRSDRCYQVHMKTRANWDAAKNIFINAASCGNESRCINHSCKPNCALYELE
ncbi:hypothetical protein PHMEG_00017348 [Phytophthora megakarya]|uniref:SET domain-containing protein n=1 Tax=Phytophthora megakarya TaxID=4795 RepID=A0A225VYL8_9STRA|nr:hypothetical protein PHMEG_00017348 [Phytophthora megakarya]